MGASPHKLLTQITGSQENFIELHYVRMLAKRELLVMQDLHAVWRDMEGHILRGRDITPSLLSAILDACTLGVQTESSS